MTASEYFDLHAEDGRAFLRDRTGKVIRSASGVRWLARFTAGNRTIYLLCAQNGFGLGRTYQPQDRIDDLLIPSGRAFSRPRPIWPPIPDAPGRIMDGSSPCSTPE